MILSDGLKEDSDFFVSALGGGERLKEKRLKLIVLVVGLCLILTLPVLATAFMPVDGEPPVYEEYAFPLHLVTVNPVWNPVPLLRTEYFAQGLRDIGIEPVIHIVDSFVDILAPGQPPGEPTITPLPRGDFQHFTFDSRGVMWCGIEDPNYASGSGYGNEWDILLWKSFSVEAGSFATYSIRYDTEPTYDFVYVQVSTDDGATWTTLKSYEGISDTNGDGVADFIEDQVDLPEGPILLGFRFFSDVAWSDADYSYDSDYGACMIDWVEVTGDQRYDFDFGDDGWTTVVESAQISRSWGFDVALYAVNFFDGAYSPNGLFIGTGLDEAFHGYCNPEYDALMDELDALGIDWNANFPDPPDLDSDDGDRALDLLETLQEMYVEEQPQAILWNRVWGGGAGSGFPVAAYNHRNPNLARAIVRQAISYGIPRQEMMEATGSQWAL
ncbi:MAG: hypothetical protein ACW99V_04725, partial [Candidatus Thorarchaeota archaeon]